MKEVGLCRLVISPKIPTDEIESLSSSIRLTSAKVQQSTTRVVGVDDIALVITIVV